MNEAFYQKLINRKREWEVIDVDPNQRLDPQVIRTLQKALAVSALELPVGEFVIHELGKHDKLPKPIINLMLSNAHDEIKHDRALGRLKAVLPPLPEDEVFMEEMVNEANRLGNLLSPILVAGVLEVSVFFVVLPIFRFLGSSGFRTVANDISNDENVHVATNLGLAKDWGYNRRPALNKLRKDIVGWLTDDLPEHHENKFMSRTYWLRASSNLYTNNRSEELRDTRNAVMPSFFEKSNKDLPVYG